MFGKSWDISTLARVWRKLVLRFLWMAICCWAICCCWAAFCCVVCCWLALGMCGGDVLFACMAKGTAGEAEKEDGRNGAEVGKEEVGAVRGLFCQLRVDGDEEVGFATVVAGGLRASGAQRCDKGRVMCCCSSSSGRISAASVYAAMDFLQCSSASA